MLLGYASAYSSLNLRYKGGVDPIASRLRRGTKQQRHPAWHAAHFGVSAHVSYGEGRTGEVSSVRGSRGELGEAGLIHGRSSRASRICAPGPASVDSPHKVVEQAQFVVRLAHRIQQVEVHCHPPPAGPRSQSGMPPPLAALSRRRCPPPTSAPPPPWPAPRPTLSWSVRRRAAQSLLARRQRQQQEESAHKP